MRNRDKVLRSIAIIELLVFADEFSDVNSDNIQELGNALSDAELEKVAKHCEDLANQLRRKLNRLGVKTEAWEIRVAKYKP